MRALQDAISLAAWCMQDRVRVREMEFTAEEWWNAACPIIEV